MFFFNEKAKNPNGENEKIEDNCLNQYSEIFLQGNNHYGSDEFLLNLS